MAAKLPDLPPTPEEVTDPSDPKTRGLSAGLAYNRSGFNLHLPERLLTCGHQGPLDNNGDSRMAARRPSVGSLAGDHDDTSYFNLLRKSPSQKSLRSLRRGSQAAVAKRRYVIAVVSELSGTRAASALIEVFISLLRRMNLPIRIAAHGTKLIVDTFIHCPADDILVDNRVQWPQTSPTPDAIVLCKDTSATPTNRDTTSTLIDLFKSLAHPLFVLLLRSPTTTPTSTATPNDPLHNDPQLSRALAQQTKVRFLRAGTTSEEIQRTLREILTTLDTELANGMNGGISPTRARGMSSPAPFMRNHSNSSTHSLGVVKGDDLNNLSNISLPNLERRGSAASAKQIPSPLPPLPPPPTPTTTAKIPSTTTLPFQKPRPFNLSLNRGRSQTHVGTSPPQSPKTLKPDLPLSTFQESLSAEFVSSRVPFVIPQLHSQTPKFVDPPSPAGTTPSTSRRHSRLLDSESDLASDTIGGEDVGEYGVSGLDGNGSSLLDEDFSRALANLTLGLATEGGGLTWEELVERLVTPGVAGDDDEFLTMFLAFYRKFAAPSKLLHSLIAKYKEASRSGIDYMLQMIVQTRCCDILAKWLQTYPHDFSYPTTHTQARTFIASLDQAFILAHYASELLPLIDNIPLSPENDMDRYWGRTDENPDISDDDADFPLDRATSHSVPLSPTAGTPSRKRSLARWDFGRKHSIKEELEAPGRLQHSKTEMVVSTTFSRGNSVSMNPSEPPSPEFSRTPSQSTVATTVDGKEVVKRLELVRSQSDISYSHFSDMELGNGAGAGGGRRHEGRERKESSASSIGSNSGAKENIKRMNAFWDSTPEEIALSLTRMEWEYFIALGPRDIPRHMWTPDEKRDKDSPMERIVYYFNHIAKWVAYTILFSPKLKDRVRDMEKMLRVVIELRKLDNYDTCFAVISGLENQSVYRLAKTLEEVKKVDLEVDEGPGRKRGGSQGSLRVGKTGSLWLKYQSCRALMARDRNFAPYRMAFKNSFGSRIPWLSRHKADMLSAAAVNKTFLAPHVVKWSGFQVIGESLLSVLQCQNSPYSLGPRDEMLERAILETPDLSEQELDAKSHELEPLQKRAYSKSHSTGSQWITKTFSRR